MNECAIFILSNGRPDKVKTYDYLKTSFSGDVYILCDDQDETLPAYKDKFGSKVIVFDKDEWVKKSDPMDNFNSKKSVLYARNAVFEIAAAMGYRYFAMADDDIKDLQFRYEQDGKLLAKPVSNLDKVIDYIVQLMSATAISYFSFGTDKNFIGGVQNRNFQKKVIDKVYNFIICKSGQQHSYKGIMNEDEIHNVISLSTGVLLKSLTAIQIVMEPVGKGETGGNSETYKENGYYSYTRNFYPIIACPFLELKPNSKGFIFGADRNLYTPKILAEESEQT